MSLHKKKKLQRFLYSPLTIVPLALLVGLLGSTVWSAYTKDRDTRLKRDKQVMELEALNTRATALDEEIERLSSERGREEEIRSKFEVAKEGERVIVIVNPIEEKEEAEREAQPNFWQRILSWF